MARLGALPRSEARESRSPPLLKIGKKEHVLWSPYTTTPYFETYSRFFRVGFGHLSGLRGNPKLMPFRATANTSRIQNPSKHKPSLAKTLPRHSSTFDYVGV